MDFNDEQIQRYSRHIILKDVGVEGQQKISNAKVLVIGVGGLGSPVLLYLAAAGIGTIGIVDGDIVDLTNLQSQVIHFTPDVDTYKVQSAMEKINKLNPNINVNTWNELATSENILNLIQDYDFIVDGTDNFPAKFLINDACVIANKPYSHAGILQFIGQTMTVVPGESACYRCVFQEPPPPNSVPSCSQAGVLGAIAGVLGALQVTEVLKFVIGKGDLLTNRIMMFDALEMKFRNLNIKKRKKCPVCGEPRQIKTLIDYEQTICELKR
jgi:molybdopterin/thiamine biosynthesis adenylyltransferase